MLVHRKYTIKPTKKQIKRSNPQRNFSEETAVRYIPRNITATQRKLKACDAENNRPKHCFCLIFFTKTLYLHHTSINESVLLRSAAQQKTLP